MSARLLVDNLFSVAQYPNHVVSATEEPSGLEAFRFATLRRNDHASASTANVDWAIKTVCDRARGADLACFWDHNLAGEAVRIQCSDDDFATPPQTAFDAVLPTTPAAGSLDDDFGVLTEDLMWVLRFPFRAAKAWRVFVPAMGAGLKPIVNGLVGLSAAFDPDMGDLVDATELMAQEERSEAGYLGRGTRALVRGGSLTIKPPTLFDYEQLRYHLQRFGAGAPAVLVFDETRAEQAVMAVRPLGRMAFRRDRSWFYPHGELPWQEHEPREAA